MTNKKFSVLVLFTAGLAVVAAFAAAPHVGPYIVEPERMAASWADNYDSLGRMTADVDAVVVASVVGVQPGRRMITGGGAVLPFTNIELEVGQTLKGEVDTFITVEQTGGEANGHAFYVDGDGGLYEVGEKVVLFLKRQPESDYYYLVNPQGRFHVQRGRLDAIDPDAPIARDLHGRRLDSAIRLIRN